MTDRDDDRPEPMDDTTDSPDGSADQRQTQGAARNPQRRPTPGGGRRPHQGAGGSRGLLDREPRELMYWVGLAVCGLLALAALVSFYTSVLDAIRTWVDPEYRSLFRAAFSLVVLVLSVLGVSLTVRELSD